MRVYQLWRKKPTTEGRGVSIVAEAILFTSGKFVVSWLGDIEAATVYNSKDDALAIHGHDGQSEFICVGMTRSDE